MVKAWYFYKMVAQFMAKAVSNRKLVLSKQCYYGAKSGTLIFCLRRMAQFAPAPPPNMIRALEFQGARDGKQLFLQIFCAISILCYMSKKQLPIF